MDNNIKPIPSNHSTTSAYRSRIPLANKSNISALARQRSPPETRWDHKDSSESQPSSHSSIYDAAWVSDQSDTAKSPYQTPAPDPTPASVVVRPSTPPHRSTATLIDPNSESPLSLLEASISASAFDTPFLYGHGTELAPIAEQRSIATLRTTATGGSSLSASNISPLLKHQASSVSSNSVSRSNANNSGVNSSNAPPRRQLRRQHSFSLDDLSPPSMQSQIDSCKRHRREYSEPGVSSGVALTGTNLSDLGAGAGIPRLRSISKRHSPPAVETVDIHAYPQKPTYPPHQEPPAPLAYTEWLMAHEGRDGYPYLPDHERPFRGVRSGHGNLQTHPYLRRQNMSIGRPCPGPGPTFDDIQESLSPRGPGQGRRTRMAPGLDPCGLVPYHPMLNDQPWVCKACGRPADQRWSLISTFVGQGRGMRRGDDWCTRCAWRKVIYLWCCCEPLGA
ncbi:hypothetical protein F4776DRAFT_217097 [Hypoxylon sp. NC0597]|nr:hypothetical protein F4776DRAFT_217097 [Hypoxylon sp. NC0597]